MNPDNQNPIPNPSLQVPPPAAPKTTVLDKVKEIYGRLPQKIRDFLSRFYSNKKVFLPISIALGLLILTLLIGLIFGTKGVQKQVISKPTPTPVVEESPTPAPAKGGVETQLKDLKSQTDNLDVNQKRLQPPAIDFKIDF